MVSLTDQINGKLLIYEKTSRESVMTSSEKIELYKKIDLKRITSKARDLLDTLEEKIRNDSPEKEIKETELYQFLRIPIPALLKLEAKSFAQAENKWYDFVNKDIPRLYSFHESAERLVLPFTKICSDYFRTAEIYLKISEEFSLYFNGRFNLTNTLTDHLIDLASCLPKNKEKLCEEFKSRIHKPFLILNKTYAPT